MLIFSTIVIAFVDLVTAGVLLLVKSCALAFFLRTATEFLTIYVTLCSVNLQVVLTTAASFGSFELYERNLCCACTYSIYHEYF